MGNLYIQLASHRSENDTFQGKPQVVRRATTIDSAHCRDRHRVLLHENFDVVIHLPPSIGNKRFTRKQGPPCLRPTFDSYTRKLEESFKKIVATKKHADRVPIIVLLLSLGRLTSLLRIEHRIV